jgi:YVTN family beta-propeller protein
LAETRRRDRTLVETRSVPVGAGPHLHIGYVKEAGRVWVSNTGGCEITLLDAATGEPAGGMEVGGGPAHFAFDAGCENGYVALRTEDAVAVVDPRAPSVRRKIKLPDGSAPTAIMPAFERSRVYTLNQGNSTVTAIDTRTDTVAATIPVGKDPMWGQPWGSSYKPITRPVGKSHVVNAGSDDVTVFDDATDTVLGKIAVGRRPVRNAIFREKGLIYVANELDGTVTAIRIADDRVVATVPVGVRPFRMLPVEGINGREELWVLNAGSATEPDGRVTMVSGTQHQVSGQIEIVDQPANWVVNPAGMLFVVASRAREMCVVDVRDGAVKGGARLSRDPAPGPISGLVYTLAHLLFVLNDDETVSVFAENGA